MKSALSLTLVASLLGSAMPVAAQDRVESTSGAVHQAIMPFRSTTAPSRHSIVVGGLVGFGVGAALGTTVGAEACLQEPRWHCAVKAGVPIAALGALVGWLRK